MTKIAQMSERMCLPVLMLARASAVSFALAHDHGHDESVSHRVEGGRLAHEGGGERVAEEVSVEVTAAMEAMVRRLLKRGEKHPPSRSEMVDAGIETVNIKAAARRLEQKLPADVASLVRVSAAGASQQPFAEESLAKARKYLNELVFKAWGELDDKLIECKEYEDRNLQTWGQVKVDIARLSETVADLMRLKAEATEMINAMEQDIIVTLASLKKETEIYMKIFMVNKAELTIRQNDLAVFAFMLKLVKCPKAAALMQVDQRPPICETAEGLVFDFGDKKAEAEIQRKMTPSARQAIRAMLERVEAVQAKSAAGLLQKSLATRDEPDDDNDDVFGDDDVGDTNTDEQKALSSLGVASKLKSQKVSEDPPKQTTTTQGLPTPPVPKMKVVKRVEEGHWKCSSGPSDCGLLHDTMSLMWGKFKDLVDELQAEMDKNEFEFNELSANLNAQLDLMRTSKARFIVELNEAVANLASTQMELAEKEEERLELEKDYKKNMKLCRKRIEWIMFQDICSYLKVRAKVMKFSKVSPPEKIVDCGVSAWTPGECSVPCDDTCPRKNNPFECGGWQTLSRDIVVASNEFGIACQSLKRQRKCGQKKCPVDCVQSRWSGWSKCTKDCEGGVRGRTRSIKVQPKNGGVACNTATESEPCNTGSCDRNCRLKKWTQWSPCSVACSGGFQERIKRVLIPIRGEGKCPKSKSKLRYGFRKCNTHECVGDEVCVAKQDLVLAIDGSGSLREAGWKALKKFVSTLIGKYKGEYYGYEDMKIAIVQFGNGEILDDGTIADALDILPFTSDMSKVQKAIEGMTYQKGFTNMAQAFTVSEKFFLLGGRKKAMAAVMTITDGKPSFLFQTNEKVMQLKDKHTKLFFVPITEFKGEELKLMKKWASSPWETNLVHVPGMEALAADPGIFAQKCLVKFCPESMSPGSMLTEEKALGFMLIRENGLCGEKDTLITDQLLGGAADCAALAEGNGNMAFALGTKWARGKCYGMKLQTTDAMIKDFNKDRANPVCPGGEWEKDALFDFYVLEPMAKA